MSRGHSVLGIANEFLLRAEQEGVSLTPIQLQKLCYMAHGFDLALFDRPLISDPVEAWDWGPVFPVLYDALKKYGGRPVPELIRENNWAGSESVRGQVVDVKLDAPERRLLDTVWKDYGHFQGFQLSALTHEDDSPWAKVYKPGKKNIRIRDKDIKDYFVGLTGDGAGQG